MNNPIKGKHADPNEPVNIRRFAVSRYKGLQLFAEKKLKEDKERWEYLFSLNKWKPSDGTNQTKKP